MQFKADFKETADSADHADKLGASIFRDFSIHDAQRNLITVIAIRTTFPCLPYRNSPKPPLARIRVIRVIRGSIPLKKGVRYLFLPRESPGVVAVPRRAPARFALNRNLDLAPYPDFLL